MTRCPLNGHVAARRAARAESLLEAVAIDNPVEAAVAGGLSVHDFARTEPADARLLASLRREDLVTSVSDQALQRALSTANDELQTALIGLTRRRYTRVSRATIEQTACAVIDLPLGAIRRHLVTGSPLPAGLRDQLEGAIRAAPAAGQTQRPKLNRRENAVSGRKLACAWVSAPIQENPGGRDYASFSCHH